MKQFLIPMTLLERSTRLVPETDIPNADPSSDKPGKQKGKLISESAKQLKVDFEGSGATTTSRKKARKSKGASAQDERIVANKAMDDTSRPDNGSEGDGKESTDKLKIKTLRIGMNSKQTTPETASPSSDESREGGNEFCVTARPKEEHY
ncbi:hypothetical protein GH714_028700 [Hevea brasiliensis]|uniref:Uncharacterized protein n=1 Tax=Hevea brasiliensis TaxID=3981 RepID=A0A6A6K9F4_HEVBR|nr:hypothetical protein GH714_028700 [Hevea brasiliensis]